MADDDFIKSIADKYGYDPSALAKVLAGRSPQPTQWAKDHPTLSSFILEALKAPMGMGAMAGPGGMPSFASGPTLTFRGEQVPVTISRSPQTGIHGETFYDALLPNGSLAGRLKVHEDNTVGNIFVDPELQRQGLATYLYNHAANDLGVGRLGAGSYQTPEGSALRSSYDATSDKP